MYTVSYLQSISFHWDPKYNRCWEGDRERHPWQVTRWQMFFWILSRVDLQRVCLLFFQPSKQRPCLRKSQARNSPVMYTCVFRFCSWHIFILRESLAANNVKSQRKYDITHKRSNGLGPSHQKQMFEIPRHPVRVPAPPPHPPPLLKS